MTAIAYRDGVLAGDTLTEWCDTDIKQVDDVKVEQHNGHLFGIAGEKCPALSLFVRYYFGDRKRYLAKKYKFQIIVVQPSGEVEFWDESGDMELVSMPYFAIGSGAGHCMGCMWKNGTAVEAVQAAITHAPGVGGRVIAYKVGIDGPIQT